MQNIYQRKSFYTFIFIMCFLNLSGITLSYFHGNTVMADELEHLRASWLVSQGYLPYRDFFEHHHPLIWFMWATIMKIMPRQIDLALYSARFFSALFSAGSLTVFFFLIKRFFGGTKNACLALCFYFIFHIWEPLHHYYWFYPYMEAIDSVMSDRYPKFDINEYLQTYKIEYINMNPLTKCDIGLNEDALPQDNIQNARNFIIKPEVYDKYERIDAGLYRRKNTK